MSRRNGTDNGAGTVLKRWFFMTVFCLLAMMSCQQCMSMIALGDTRTYKYKAEKARCTPDSRYGLVYGGVRGDVDFMAVSVRGESHPHSMIPDSVVFTFALLDFPLSAVVDTVVLPVTLPWASYRHFHARSLSKEVASLPAAEKAQRIDHSGDVCLR